MSKGGLKGNHLRHHVNRRLWGKSCAICKEQKSRGLSLAESPTDRPPSRREDEDFDLDVDQSGGDNAPLGPRKDAEELSLRELDDLRAHEQWRIEQGLDDSTASAAS
jgi:hypothetical protein